MSTPRDKHGVPVNREAADRFWESMMRHDVPRSSRSKPKRPVSVKPPKCTVCGYWLAPNFDHSACKSG